MAMPFETTGYMTTATRVLFDPLSYVNAQRLRLPRALDTPRQRAVVNRLLLGTLPDERQAMSIRRHPLLAHWERLPYICVLIGAQRLKSQLAWGGRSLRLPAVVRRFMVVPLAQAVAPEQGAAVSRPWETAAGPLARKELLLAVQHAGLSCLLDWQRQAPALLLDRLRLLFPPQLDGCFEADRRPLQTTDLFLISQAIHYAQNHPYHV